MRAPAPVLALIAVLTALPAAALDPAAPAPITTKGLNLGGAITCAAGSVCDASPLSVTANGATQPLSAWLPQLAPKASPVFTGTSLTTPGTVTPQAIYTSAFPNVVFSDAVQGVLDIPAGDPNDNRAAVAGYVRTRSGGAGPVGKGNGVALMGAVQIANDKSAGWGVNTLITDNAARKPFAGTGRIATGAELDFNIMSPNTQVIGVSIGGNSLAQPSEANGYLVNPLGNGNRWGTGFWSLDGAATRGLVLGALQVSGRNVKGQPIWLQAFDGAGAKRTGVIQQDGAYITLADLAQGSWPGLKIQQGDLTLDGGHGVIVGGTTVLVSRQTGWTPGTGTPNRGAFNADGTQTLSATYSQAQVQALQDMVTALQRRVLALEQDLAKHGLIGK
ncbi:hypothetical protein [Methylobacterium symbioticum]|uniref:Peptidase S74 domain-containing protein n=1 Tax=Methylobacterium symbioticum TaxID=2584084 RepID=A0A509EFG6_9HYPH|nr:hypothetical protein [Methylobacterium symbioticum]VUD72931.1 hypothetical protein MET9862_03538 [Methylobacterium symbioticum]